ncbi:MAG: hypothetical protein E4G91_04785 [Candidatus Zixiibacteriota bacterium]|nr:MAG: hypothetical protein E4G91_04785 [candidate division Zixibacteria bacterium]
MKFRLICLMVTVLAAQLAAQSADTAWVRVYGAVNSAMGSDLCVDHDGNVIVAGGAKTLKYAANGELHWVGDYGGQYIGVDGLNNIIVGAYWGYPNPVYRVIKYLPSGDTAWVRTYDGPIHSQAFPFGMVVDEAGNSYITGEAVAEGGDGVYGTVKYLPNGDTAWARIYNGAPTDWDRPLAIAIDKLGNVYVTGYSRIGVAAAATVKYYPNGDTAWVRRFSTTWTEGHHIAVDESGNVFVSIWNNSYKAIKYDKDGNLLWTGTLGGGEVSVDAAGNSYFAYAWSGLGVVKYLPNGDTAWTREYTSPLDPSDRVSDLTTDASGNSFVTGYGYQQLAEDDRATDYVTIKYDTNGNPDWIKRFDGIAHLEDRSMAIAIDQSGCVFVTGGSMAGSGRYDVATIKYQPSTPVCGDIDGFGSVDISDVVYLLSYIFLGGTPPLPLSSGSVNCDQDIDISDVVYLILFIFSGGFPPCAGC